MPGQPMGSKTANCGQCVLQASAVRPCLEQKDLPLQIQCILLLCKDKGDVPQVAANGADVLQQQWAWLVRVASPDFEHHIH